jgi:galactofuranose transport system substrate-binding protein
MRLMTSKALLAATGLVVIALSLPATAAELSVGFSQIGSVSGWRAAETAVSKSEAAKRNVTLKIAAAQQIPLRPW